MLGITIKDSLLGQQLSELTDVVMPFCKEQLTTVVMLLKTTETAFCDQQLITAVMLLITTEDSL
jgi:hypothetical protein